MLDKVDWTTLTDLGVELRRSVTLAALTTIKVGGPAEYFATVTTIDQLVSLVRWAQEHQLPYFLLGGGSNILISDDGIRGLVIHNRCRSVSVTDETLQMAESGAAMAGVARQSVNMGLTGSEWAVSVPGTIGGAVVNNAGAHGGEIKDSLERARVINATGTIADYRVGDFGYDYRTSSLKRQRLLQAGFKPVVLTAGFRLHRGEKAATKGLADRYLQHRRSTQPVEPSLGSTFVNPPGDFAGRLIEAAGLKGHRIGGVEVSMTHANFIVNPDGVGTASAADVVALIEFIRSIVSETFGVLLEPEVQMAGEWPQTLP